MVNLFKKELAFYLNNPVGYIVAILFAVFANFLFVKDLFLRGDSSMRYFFEFLPWLTLIFVPAATMRVFAEEKRTNTIEVLLTLPFAELTIVVAKFLAISVFASVSLLLTISIPLALTFIGEPVMSEIVVAYVGSVLLIASFTALSVFFSSLTKNQVAAFLSAVIVLFFATLLGTEFLSSSMPQFVQPYLLAVSPMYHYESFLKGLIDARAVFYFLSLVLVFIFLTTVNIEKRD